MPDPVLDQLLELDRQKKARSSGYTARERYIAHFDRLLSVKIDDEPVATAEEVPKNWQGHLADLVDYFQSGLIRSGADIAGLLGIATGSETVKGFAENLHGRAEQAKSTLSQGAKDSRSQFVVEAEDGSYSLGDAWTDIEAWKRLGGEGIGSLAGSLATGGPLSALFKKGAVKLAQGQINRAIAKDAAKLEAAGIVGEQAKAELKRRIDAVSEPFKKIGSRTGFGTAIGAQVGGATGRQAEEEVLAMPFERLNESQEYATRWRAIKNAEPGLDNNQIHERARSEVATAASKSAAAKGFAIGAISGGLTGPILDDIIKGAFAATAKGGALKGLAVEGGTEFVEEGAQQAAVNVALQREADPKRRTMAGVLPAAVEGGLGGAMAGGVAGGVAGAVSSPQAKTGPAGDELDQALDGAAKQGEQFALPSPKTDPIVVSPSGTAGTARQRADLGFTPDVERAAAGYPQPTAPLAAALLALPAPGQTSGIPMPDQTGARAPDEVALRELGLTPDVRRAQASATRLPIEPTPTAQPAGLALARLNDKTFILRAPLEVTKALGLKGVYNKNKGGLIVPVAKAPDVQATLNEYAKNPAAFQPVPVRRAAGKQAPAQEPASLLSAPAPTSSAPQTAQAPTAAPGVRHAGAETRITAADGSKTAARWAVVDATEIQATMGRAENQPRDRTRAASQAQIGAIAKRPDYDLVSDAPTLTDGAPALAPDGRVVAGNGRFAGIAQAYAQGTAEEYRVRLKADAVAKGLDPAAIDAVKNPVLVRMLPEGTDVSRMAVLSNEGGAMRMSALEQAKVDADRLGDIGELATDDAGSVNLPGNRAYVRRMLSDMPIEQQAAFVDAKGGLSQEGAMRLRNAVLFKAYGDTETLTRLVESSDAGARTVLSALLRAAPRMAKLREDIGAGRLQEADIVPDLVRAVELFSALKAEGKTVESLIQDGDLVGYPDVTTEALDMARWFEANIRSATKMAALLDAYAAELERYGSPGEDMLGGKITPKKAEVLSDAEKRASRETGAVRPGPAKPAGETVGAARRDAEGGRGVPASEQRQPQQAEGQAQQPVVAAAQPENFRLTQQQRTEEQSDAELRQEAESAQVDAFGGQAQAAQEQATTREKERTATQPSPALGGGLFAETDEKAHQAATSPLNETPEPTPAQKEAGNYAKGHVRIAGLDISIENPAGSRRRPEWPALKSHYGYIRGTKGRDKDHLDVFVRPGTPEDYGGPVFVVDQVRPLGRRFDEHKVMLGWNSEEAARAAYLENYQKGWKGLGAITRMTMDGFKAWLEGDTTQPVAGAGVPRSKLNLKTPEFRAWMQQVEHHLFDQAFMEGEMDGMTASEVIQTTPGSWDILADAYAKGDKPEDAAKAVVLSTKPADFDDPATGIEDFGEKIGGARKDTAVSTGPRRAAAAQEDATPAWRKRFVTLQSVKTGVWSIMDKRTKRVLRDGWKSLEFATEAEAERNVPLAAVALKHRVVSRTQKSGETVYEIVRDVTDRKRVKVVEQDFPTREAALKHLADNAVQIIETKTGFGEEILAKPEKAMRTGKARRQGAATAQTFTDTFGFRGVEFGNWNNQDERQEVMNHAFDGLLDMAEILGIPPRAISLNGELALAFGARGQGLSGAKAHYERDYGVINLTKMSGAGSLAHEWFHALDHYFARQDSKAAPERIRNADGDLVFPAGSQLRDYMSHGRSTQSKVRPEVWEAYERLVTTMFRKAEQYVEDTARAEKFVGDARRTLQGQLDQIRASLAKPLEYMKRNNRAATTEELAAFDALAEKILAGGDLKVAYRPMSKPGVPVGARGGMLGRRTNDTLEAVSAINKAVRGRTGFSKEGTGPLDYVRNYMSQLEARIGMLESARKGDAKTKQVPTSYAMESKKIDQGRATDYWTTPHEMAARAFSAYIEDKAAEQGNVTQFLAYGSDNKFYRLFGLRPFPEGDERRAINAEFDKLFRVLEAAETERGVALRSERVGEGGGIAMSVAKKVADRLTETLPNAPRVLVYESPSQLPPEIRGETDERTEGLFHRGTNGDVVYLFANAIASEGRAEWVVLHEIAGHYGLRGALGADFDKALTEARKNVYVARLADAIKADRKRKSLTDAAATEEALSELAAAVETGDFDAIAQRYRLSVPLGFRKGIAGAVGRFFEAVRAIVRRLFGRDAGFSDADVRALLEASKTYLRGEQEATGLAPALAQSRASALEVALRRMERAIDEYMTGGVRPLDTINLGETPEILRALGAPELPLDTTGSMLDKVFKGKHLGDRITPAMLKELPEHLHDPLAVFESDTTPGAFVVLTEMETEHGRPVLAAVHVNRLLKRVRVNRVATVFGKQRREALTGWARKGLLRYVRNDESPGPSTKFQHRFAGDLVQAARDSGTEYKTAADLGQRPAPETRESVAPEFVGLNDAQQRAMRNVGGIVDKVPFRERAADWRKDLGKKLVQRIADQFHPIKELDQHAYMLDRLSKGSDGAVEALMLFGNLRLIDGVYDSDAKGVGVIEFMQKLQGEHNRFLWWIAANRAEGLKTEEREHLFSEDDIRDLKTLNQGRMPDGSSRAMAYSNALAEYNRVSANVLDMAEQSGTIDPESRAIWEKEFYVPFYRAMEDGISGPNIARKSGLVRQYAFKKLKGGREKIHQDLMANVMMNWAHLISSAAKNRGAEASLLAAERAGVATRIEEEQKGAVFYLKNGQKEWYTVEDPYVLEAISALEYNGLTGPTVAIMAKFKRALTIGVTASPVFKIRNLIRDSISALASTPLGYNPIQNVAEGAGIMRNKRGQEFASLLASGGIIRFGTMLEGNRSIHLQKLINAGVDENTIVTSWDQIKDKFQVAIDKYNELGDISEGANRAALYRQLRAQGKTHAEAAFAARDLLDFSMGGTSGAVRFLTTVVPFMNARIQGIYKLGRGAKDDPRRFAAVTGAVALASIALMLAYEDDEDWKEREDWDRDNYWWFKIEGVAYRIPKPFEVGAIGTLAERGVELFASDEMTGERFMKRLGSMIGDTFAMNPVPQLFKPMVDVYANVDSFTGRPIEKMSMERLEKSQRYDGRTSEIARFLGLAGDYTGASPAQIDHMIRAYFGWLGSAVTTAVDYGIRPMMDRADRPTMKLRDILVVGAFAEELPAGSSRYVTMFYEQAREVEEAYATWRQKLKEGDTEGAAEYLDENTDRIRQRHRFGRARRRLADLNARVRAIENSSVMSPEEKRERIDLLLELKQDLARAVTRT